MVIKISSVCTLARASLKVTQNIADAFGISYDINSEDFNALKHEITRSVKFAAKFGDSCKPEESWFCFGKSGNFVCTLPEFNEKDHKLNIQSKFEHPDVNKNSDKLCMLMQMSQYDLEEEAWFLWCDLVLPQVWNVCRKFDVNVKNDKGNIEKLMARVTKSAKFQNDFGTSSMDKLQFKFQLSNPYTCMEVAIKNRKQDTPESVVEESPVPETSNMSDKTHESENLHENNMQMNGRPGTQTSKSDGKENSEKVVDFVNLSGEQFEALLDVFQLIANPHDSWDKQWNTLQYSKYFKKHFGDCRAEDLVVIIDQQTVVNVKSKDGIYSLKKVKCIYPCVECSKEVTDTPGASGDGLQCNKCNRFFHNQCMSNPVSKALYNALTKSPDYIQIFCQECMSSQKMVEKISTDMELMKKEMTWATKVSNGLVQNVEKAVVSMEKTTKTNKGFMNRVPLAGQSPEAVKKMREEKMSRTAVIIKPEMKTNSSYDIRKEFNRHFPDTAIKAAIPTATGSVRLEFDSQTSRDEVMTGWKDSMFGGNKGLKTPSLKATMGVIKGVNTEESVDDITDDIQATYPGTTVDFFRRNMKITGTIKLIFKNNEVYTKAMEDGGIMIGGIKYLMEQFVFKPRVIRCFRCQSYGHIGKNCRAKEAICGKCCKVGHESRDCETPLTNKSRCFHCKEPHSTGSKDCSEYKRVEDKINSLNYGL